MGNRFHGLLRFKFLFLVYGEFLADMPVEPAVHREKSSAIEMLKNCKQNNITESGFYVILDQERNECRAEYGGGYA